MGKLELLAKIIKVIESCKTVDQCMTCWNWIEKTSADKTIKVQAYNRLLTTGRVMAADHGREPRG